MTSVNDDDGSANRLRASVWVSRRARRRTMLAARWDKATRPVAQAIFKRAIEERKKIRRADSRAPELDLRHAWAGSTRGWALAGSSSTS